MYLLKVGRGNLIKLSSIFVCSREGCAMSRTTRVLSFALLLMGLISPIGLSGCGLFTPEKYPFTEDAIDPASGTSTYGNIEDAIVDHVVCEISKGIYDVWDHRSGLQYTSWLYSTDWGVSVTITLTFEDQSALNPGVSLTTPLENSIRVFPVGGNVTSPQSFALGLGGAGTGNATRQETIQFTYTNKVLLKWGQQRIGPNENYCDVTNKGIMINSDLKIDQFIYDKMSINSNGNVFDPANVNSPPFNTFQEQLTFVASLNANATPTWKFARGTANTTSPLITATRTDTDALTITFGQVQPATPNSPAQLKTSGAGSAGGALHQSAVNANMTGQAVNKSTSP
jgi:hypothetical protein